MEWYIIFHFVTCHVQFVWHDSWDCICCKCCLQLLVKITPGNCDYSWSFVLILNTLFFFPFVLFVFLFRSVCFPLSFLAGWFISLWHASSHDVVQWFHICWFQEGLFCYQSKLFFVVLTANFLEIMDSIWI